MEKIVKIRCCSLLIMTLRNDKIPVFLKYYFTKDIMLSFPLLAWYGHLKILHDAPLWQAILFSWCIALLEYSFMIPATKLLSQHGWSLEEMKITQEVVTLIVFVPFMIFLFKQPFKLDYVWAMFCLMGCVYFVFRNQS